MDFLVVAVDALVDVVDSLVSFHVFVFFYVLFFFDVLVSAVFFFFDVLAFFTVPVYDVFLGLLLVVFVVDVLVGDFVLQ